MIVAPSLMGSGGEVGVSKGCSLLTRQMEWVTGGNGDGKLGPAFHE